MVNKNLIALVAVGVVVVAGAGLIVAGVLPNPFVSPSSDFLERAFINTFNAKTVKNEFQITVDVSGVPVLTEDQEPKGQTPARVMKISLEGASQSDLTDKANPKVQGNFTISAETEGLAMSGSGEVRMVNKITYIKFDTLPIFFELAGVKGQWLKIDPEQIKKQLETEGAENSATFTQEQYLQMAEDFKNVILGKGLFQVKKKLGEEKVKNESAERYLVALNKNAVKKILPEVLQLFKKYMTPAEQADFDKQLATTTQNLPVAIDALWQKTGEINFDVWLANDKIKQVRIEKTLDLSSYPEVQKSIKQAKVDILLNFIYSDYGKPVTIEEPQNAKPFDEVLNSASSPATSTTP